MSGEWLILRSGAGGAAWNMALDEALLEFASALGRPLLRFYAWTEPAASFGYFQRYAEAAEWTPLRPLIRRPTGGGLVPHDADWTYSLVFPPGSEWHSLRAEESYRRVHDWISRSFGELQIEAELAAASAKDLPGRCFAGAEKFDVLVQGRKIAGAAQKRNQCGLLVQGSIQPGGRRLNRAEWEGSLMREAEKRGVVWAVAALPRALIARAEALEREKYGTAAYNQRR